LPKILSLSSQKYGFGIRDPEKTYSGSRIPDPGVKKAPDPGSGSATLVWMVKFADDTKEGKIIENDSDREELQMTLDLMCDWADT
jgi:hypothetical protein